MIIPFGNICPCCHGLGGLYAIKVGHGNMELCPILLITCIFCGFKAWKHGKRPREEFLRRKYQ